jgi:hypothetical protein
MTRLGTPSPSDARLLELMNELEALRSELGGLHGHQAGPGPRRWGRASRAWPAAALIVAGAWALSAQTPTSIPPDIEERLSALEKRIRGGPGNTTQVTAPFDVLGPDGKAVLRVGGGGQPSGSLVHIGHIPGGGGLLTILSDNGTDVAGVGASTEGHGAVYAADARGTPRAQLNGTGAVGVFDDTKKQVAVMINKQEGGGRIGIWNSAGQRVAMLDVEAENGDAGALSVMDPAGKVLGRLGLHPQGGKDAALAIMSPAGKPVAVVRSSGETGAMSVMNSSGKAVAGLLGSGTGGGTVAVATSNGASVAEMAVSDDGRGVVQVRLRGGGAPVAVLSQATDGLGGLVQVSNGTTPVANFTVGGRGGGYFQLADPSGNPTVEAGTLPNGRGTVRAGPNYLCSPAQPATPVMTFGLPDCLLGNKK